MLTQIFKLENQLSEQEKRMSIQAEVIEETLKFLTELRDGQAEMKNKHLILHVELMKLKAMILKDAKEKKES